MKSPLLSSILFDILKKSKDERNPFELQLLIELQSLGVKAAGLRTEMRIGGIDIFSCKKSDCPYKAKT